MRFASGPLYVSHSIPAKVEGEALALGKAEALAQHRELRTHRASYRKLHQSPRHWAPDHPGGRDGRNCNTAIRARVRYTCASSSRGRYLVSRWQSCIKPDSNESVRFMNNVHRYQVEPSSCNDDCCAVSPKTPNTSALHCKHTRALAPIQRARAMFPRLIHLRANCLNHPHFPAKKLVPRSSAHEMRTDSRRGGRSDRSTYRQSRATNMIDKAAMHLQRRDTSESESTGEDGYISRPTQILL